ncbi:hypothetical protein DMN91_009385 [Ooceraea biroi]|uniref:Uncharacterized protein n=2 Tax=Ooceraea biroi TaxID=2015173 RepID=A0A3L8DF01_OOCBI|nr:hypothetical protein DMN91_009385 [Ooceraea biroi]
MSAVADSDALRMVLEELKQFREERHQERQERQQMQAEMQRMEQRLVERSVPQISERSANVSAGGDGGARRNLGYKLKPDIFDGTVPLREFFAQFSLIARANDWNESAKAVALASSLRGKARAVLDSVADVELLEFPELKSKLELRFGESEFAQNYYYQFINRKQRFGEDFSTLGADLERLSRLAYPECSHEVRDKIACSQFVAALSEGFIKRTIQLEEIISLKAAIERANQVRIEALTKDNYDSWCMQIEALMTKNDTWKYASGELLPPTVVEGDAREEAELKNWLKKDKMAKSDLILSISSNELQ